MLVAEVYFVVLLASIVVEVGIAVEEGLIGCVQ
jgi:hypothetical protein